MPRTYAPQFRTIFIEQVRAVRRVAEVAAELELCQGTVFRWFRQDRIDRGELTGTPTAESAELRAAKHRIAELESSWRPSNGPASYSTGGRVVRPKTSSG